MLCVHDGGGSNQLSKGLATLGLAALTRGGAPALESSYGCNRSPWLQQCVLEHYLLEAEGCAVLGAKWRAV